MITIPPQLEHERFIVLSRGGKTPVQRWSDPRYQYTAAEITPWLRDGWNYAVLYQSDLCVLDADKADLLLDLGVIQALPPTFTVMSGRDGLGLHGYFRLSDPPDGTKVHLCSGDGAELGDLRLPHSRFYNVGPGCVHPTGNRYSIVNDVPIARVTWGELAAAFDGVMMRFAGVRVHREPLAVCALSGTLAAYGFSVFDFLMPERPRLRGDEIEGAHPVHGSTSGTNLTVRKDGSVWWCRRCGSGGNWIDALAVAEGIIPCSEAHPGRRYSKQEWREIFGVLRQRSPDVYARLQRVRRAGQTFRVAERLAQVYAQRMPEAMDR